MPLRTIIFVVFLSALTSVGASILLNKYNNSAGSETSKAVMQDAIEPLLARITALEQPQKTTPPVRKSESTAAGSGAGVVLPESGSGFEGEAEEALDVDVSPRQTEQFRSRLSASRVRDGRRRNLVKGGFTIEEADWVLQQESDAQLDSLYTQFQARKARADLERENGAQAPTSNELLKDKLGLDYYEQYLESNGYPTSISIGSVLQGSPGSDAGLQPGDQILYYGGERVFNIRELNDLTVQGDSGQSVLIELERDGAPVQLTIPRGPIGIFSGRRGRNRF